MDPIDKLVREATPLLASGNAATRAAADAAKSALVDLGNAAKQPLQPRPSGLTPLEVAASVAVLSVRRLRRRTTLFGTNKVVHKTMGGWGSFLFLSNLITGPGMLGLPAAFLCGGYVVAGGFTVVFAALSALCCAFIAHACRVYRAERLRASVRPGAYEHELGHHPHLEFETLVRALAHPLLWAGFQVIFYFSMVLMTISCIVVTASSLDTLSLLLLDNAWGLQLSPRLAWVASCPGAGGADALFGTPSAGDVACASQAVFDATAAAGGHIISAGYMLTVALTLPFALIEISEAFQATAYCISLACLLQLIAKFTCIALFPAFAGGGPADGAALAAMAAASPPAPLLRPIGRDLGVVAEVSFWSWCISFAVPMWLDEKAEALPISRPLWLSFTHRAVLDLLLGLSGAAAFPRMSPERLNVLDAVAVHPACGALTKACGVLFVISSLAPNIVDYSMVAARNLECHLGTGAANGLGIAVPFAVAFLFYFGTSFSTLVNVASPLLNGLVQFVVPALLFAAYERLDSSGGSVTPPSASASTHGGGSAWNHAFSAAAAEAGRATLAPGAGRYVRVLGLNLPVDTWRRAAIALAAAIVALIAATYVLNETVGSAIIRADSAHGNADYSS